MPGYDFFMKPKDQEISIALEEVHNNLYSLMLIDRSCETQGLVPELVDICLSMSDELKYRNRLVMNGLYYATVPMVSCTDFESYLLNLEQKNPIELRDQILNVYLYLYEEKFGYKPDSVSILKSPEAYISFLSEIFDTHKIDEEIESDAFNYVVKPAHMRDLIVSHLRDMWNRFLKGEWEKNRHVLEESVQAYKEAGIEAMGKVEALKTLCCDDMDYNWEQFQRKIEKVKKVYLVPSVHQGLFKGKIYHFDSDEMWFFYGSLIPDGTVASTPELNKADILVHLSAFTDGTRLEILKLCSGGGEYSSVQLMNELRISQSAVSRHLKQLSATGFLNERRENSSKYYRINKQKIKNTISSFEGYLGLDSDS